MPIAKQATYKKPNIQNHLGNTQNLEAKDKIKSLVQLV
jgi:hypothetical protein